MGEAALLFDLDGTMLVSDPIHVAVFADMLAPHGIVVDEAFYMARIHGRLNADIFAEFLPGHPDLQALSEAKEAEFRRRLPRPYPAMPGLRTFLDRSSDEGIATAVVTNAPRINAEAMLAAIGLDHRFDVIVSGEECLRGKPDPEPYLVAMRLLGAAPDHAVAFEDSPSGVRSAKAAGAWTVGIRSSLDHAALAVAGADLTLKDFTDPALDGILQRLTGVSA